MTNPSETNQPDRTELQQVLESIADLKGEFKDLKSDVETFNEKFDNYQKATQWVVGLAFSLIGSATVITIISSVFRR
jgi:molecular chaperone GrpE (heat shock protein)